MREIEAVEKISEKQLRKEYKFEEEFAGLGFGGDAIDFTENNCQYLISFEEYKRRRYRYSLKELGKLTRLHYTLNHRQRNGTDKDEPWFFLGTAFWAVLAGLVFHPVVGIGLMGLWAYGSYRNYKHWKPLKEYLIFIRSGYHTLSDKQVVIQKDKLEKKTIQRLVDRRKRA